MIETKNLCKSFEGREVLKDISTVFEDGKTNLIIGQSGSGKTVLMKNLVGLLDPTSGEVLYDARDGYDLPECCAVRLDDGAGERDVPLGYVFDDEP